MRLLMVSFLLLLLAVPVAASASVSTDANKICKEFSARAKSELGNPDINDPKAAGKYFRKAVRFAKQQNKALAALDPSSAPLQTLVKANKGSIRLLRKLAKAAADNDKQRAERLIEELTPISERVDNAAKDLGAKACGTG